MAVAEVTETTKKKSDKSDGDSGKPTKPGAMAGAAGWLPRKLTELKTFLVEVRAELKKVTGKELREGLLSAMRSKVAGEIS